MNLEKATRKELRDAATRREAITITWPEEVPYEPQVGHNYRLEGFAEDARLLVERRIKAEVESGWEAEVRLNHDPVRLLRLPGQRNELGDFEDEPERVPEKYEERLAEEGRLKTALAGAQQRQMQAVVRKEESLSTAKSARSERAKRRHLESQKRKLGSEAA